MKYNRMAFIGVVFLLAVLAAPGPARSATLDQAPASLHAAHSQEKPMGWDLTLLSARLFLGRLPAEMPGSQDDTPERIALGKRLYFERGISTHKSQSCHDCHLLTEGRAGADVTATSKGAMGTFGTRNSPTVINAGFQAFQFWDGRVPDLFEQAKGPILNPVEMAMKTPEEVCDNLRKVEGYPEAFRRAFPGTGEAVTYDHLAEAIAAFERTLAAPARFDQLVDGREEATTRREKHGLTKFIQYHCVECHSGATVGGQLFKIVGQRHPYTDTRDVGRYEVTKKEEDRFVFKVPMLRNVTRTAPYFSDGKVPTIEDAVRLMGWHQLDHKLTRDDIDELVAFLSTLEGDPPPVTAP